MKLLLILSLIITSSVFAQKTKEEVKKDWGKQKAERFKKIDTNSDGFISLEEFAKKATNKNKSERRFKRIDDNNDGKISKEEFESIRKNKREKLEKTKKELTNKRNNIKKEIKEKE